MEIKRIMRNRILPAAVLAGIVLTTQTACDEVGKKFDITGHVLSVGEDEFLDNTTYVQVGNMVIKSADKAVKSWLKESEDVGEPYDGRVYDTYHECYDTSSYPVGMVFDEHGNRKPLKDLRKGEMVEITGTVEISEGTCTGKGAYIDEVLVFNAVHELPHK